MSPLAAVALWLALVAGGVAWIAWQTRHAAPTVRDSELQSTEPADPDSLPDTDPGSVVWLQHPWINTIPSRPMPLDQPKD